jgi:hypothetical protein
MLLDERPTASSALHHSCQVAQSYAPMPQSDHVSTTFHAGGTQSWITGRSTISLLHQLVRPGDRTVETGAGASTVTFAELGAVHTAISPSPDEHEKIRIHCAAIGIDTSRLDFISESSDIALPRLVARGELVDLVFIDGKHAFPLPAVDYNYANRLLRPGGILIMDDAPIRAVKMVCGFLSESPHWKYLATTDDRTLAYRKLGEAPTEDDWMEQPMNRVYPDFWFLPTPRRVYMTARAAGSHIRRQVLGG